MSFNRKILISLLFSMSAVLSGCGGGGSNNAAATTATPGNCAAGSVYSQQYGCLPQGNCPVGMGQYTASGVNQCVQSQTNPTGQIYPTGPYSPYGTSTCAPGQLMTEKGCLPQYTCPVNQGYLQGRCYPGYVNAMPSGFGTDDEEPIDYDSEY